jgi:hypothetical protein
MLTAINNSPVGNTFPRILYLDGSLSHSGTKQVNTASGVGNLHQNIHLPIKE